MVKVNFREDIEMMYVCKWLIDKKLIETGDREGRSTVQEFINTYADMSHTYFSFIDDVGVRHYVPYCLTEVYGDEYLFSSCTSEEFTELCAALIDKFNGKWWKYRETKSVKDIADALKSRYIYENGNYYLIDEPSD